LTETDWPLFNTLRNWRSERAKQEGIPPYVICNNRHLAEIVKARPQTLAALGQIEGVGEAKIKKYGKELLAFIVGEPTKNQEASDAES
jgi:ATP-dependent DNA helicase RecQ